MKQTARNSSSDVNGVSTLPPTFPMAKPRLSLLGTLECLGVLSSGAWTQSRQVGSLEARVPKISGVFSESVGVAVSSGTDALIIALRALGVKSGDEVLVTAFSFAASAHAISMTGARPVFCDTKVGSFATSLDSAETLVSERTKGVLLAQLFGDNQDLRPWREFCDQRGLFLLEDAAQSLGSTGFSADLSELADATCLSFYATKNVFAGEGGMVLSRDERLSTRMKYLRNQGMRSRYEFIEPGFNSRMQEVSATIALDAIRQLRVNQKKRARIARKYEESISGGPWLLPRPSEEGAHHGWHQYTLICETKNVRESAVARLKEARLPFGIFYPQALSRLAYYSSEAGMTPNAEALAERVISLPIYPGLSTMQVAEVARALSGIR